MDKHLSSFLPPTGCSILCPDSCEHLMLFFSFFYISLRDLLISSSRDSIIIIRLDFRSFSCVLVVLGYPGLVSVV